MSERTIQQRQCRVEKCCNKAEKKGWCGKHYMRMRRHGTTDTRKNSLLMEDHEGIKEWILRFTKVDPVSGCWNWTRGVCDKRWRYGSLKIQGRKIKAHRASAVAYLGYRPDSGLLVLHHCDNPPCCNPNHLFLGTTMDNVRDMQEKGRANHPNGSACGNSKLTDEKVKTILRMRRMGATSTAIAKKFRISTTNAKDIFKRKIWKHVHDADL